MPSSVTKTAHARRSVEEAAERAQRELRQVIAYLNDEVVPTVRVESSRALRVAARKLLKLAHYMDENRRRS